MSNLESDPSEVDLVEPVPEAAGGSVGFEILEPRDVPLGGPRAMSVRRTLPQRSRSLIGAWCFVDHYGPDLVAASGGMLVPPHPHTGLQTVSWLFEGEIDHRDSVGSHAEVRPGELNLMTAGRGIQHSEVSLPRTTVLHGAQLRIALPDAARETDPFFERFVAVPFEHDGATLRVFLGELLGHRSTARTFTRVVGAQLDLPAATTVRLPVDPVFEHGLLVDMGAATLEGHPVARDQLGYVPPGVETLTITSGDEPLRALLIGGEPLGESIVMWWNFIGRSHEEVVEFRRRWQAEVIAGENPDGLFGRVRDYDGTPLPAPELPNVRLRPRS
jgi:hypothetical protein